jgi:hypothetical protein
VRLETSARLVAASLSEESSACLMYWFMSIGNPTSEIFKDYYDVAACRSMGTTRRRFPWHRGCIEGRLDQIAKIPHLIQYSWRPVGKDAAQQGERSLVAPRAGRRGK